jgi:hypothetical protein
MMAPQHFIVKMSDVISLMDGHMPPEDPRQEDAYWTLLQQLLAQRATQRDRWHGAGRGTRLGTAAAAKEDRSVTAIAAVTRRQEVETIEGQSHSVGTLYR